mgnify:CR=1 FL=1
MKEPIDAIGKACPIPFMLAKKEIDANNTLFTILVDNKGAVENLKRLATATHYTHSVEPKGLLILVTLTNNEEDGTIEKNEINEHKHRIKEENSSIISRNTPQQWTLFIGKETMGDGEKELGKNLLRMHLYTIDATNDLPATIICMNSGVQVATTDQQSITTLKSLQNKGVSIIVCGTCLDYYHLLDELKVGEIGNMYDITKILTSSPKVISI